MKNELTERIESLTNIEQLDKFAVAAYSLAKDLAEEGFDRDDIIDHLLSKARKAVQVGCTAGGATL